MGKEATSCYKWIASLLALERNTTYSQMMAWICCRCSVCYRFTTYQHYHCHHYHCHHLLFILVYLASFPGRFGREKRPGNFREFKLYTDVTHGNCIPHSSSEVHMILLIFSPAENGLFLLMEATVLRQKASRRRTNKSRRAEHLYYVARSRCFNT